VTGLLGRFNPSLPVTQAELEASGLFDIPRYTNPYIREHLIENYFSAQDREFVKKTFFTKTGTFEYAFKPEYSTEKGIEVTV
jgi:hypothetical protein